MIKNGIIYSLIIILSIILFLIKRNIKKNIKIRSECPKPEKKKHGINIFNIKIKEEEDFTNFFNCLENILKDNEGSISIRFALPNKNQPIDNLKLPEKINFNDKSYIKGRDIILFFENLELNGKIPEWLSIFNEVSLQGNNFAEITNDHFLNDNLNLEWTLDFKLITNNYKILKQHVTLSDKINFKYYTTRESSIRKIKFDDYPILLTDYYIKEIYNELIDIINQNLKISEKTTEIEINNENEIYFEFSTNIYNYFNSNDKIYLYEFNSTLYFIRFYKKNKQINDDMFILFDTLFDTYIDNEEMGSSKRIWLMNKIKGSSKRIWFRNEELTQIPDNMKELINNVNNMPESIDLNYGKKDMQEIESIIASSFGNKAYTFYFLHIFFSII